MCFFPQLFEAEFDPKSLRRSTGVHIFWTIDIFFYDHFTSSPTGTAVSLSETTLSPKGPLTGGSLRIPGVLTDRSWKKVRWFSPHSSPLAFFSLAFLLRQWLFPCPLFHAYVSESAILSSFFLLSFLFRQGMLTPHFFNGVLPWLFLWLGMQADVVTFFLSRSSHIFLHPDLCIESHHEAENTQPLIQSCGSLGPTIGMVWYW